MKTRVFVMTVALLSGAPGLAQVTGLASSNPAPKGNDANKMVCEVEQTTGTRLGARKVCKTQAEWAQLREEHRSTLEKFQQQATSTGTPAN